MGEGSGIKDEKTSNANMAFEAYALHNTSKGFGNTATRHEALYSNTEGRYYLADGIQTL